MDSCRPAFMTVRVFPHSQCITAQQHFLRIKYGYNLLSHSPAAPCETSSIHRENLKCVGCIAGPRPVGWTGPDQREKIDSVS